MVSVVQEIGSGKEEEVGKKWKGRGKDIGSSEPSGCRIYDHGQ